MSLTVEFNAFINRGSGLSFKVFFKSPLSCLGLARWLPVNADVARKFIKDPEFFKIYRY